jgi:hypothetical protein
MSGLAKLKRDPTGLAEIEGRGAVFRAAYTSATSDDITTSKTMRVSKGKGLKKPMDVHPHHQRSSPKSRRAK